MVSSYLVDATPLGQERSLISRMVLVTYKGPDITKSGVHLLAPSKAIKGGILVERNVCFIFYAGNLWEADTHPKASEQTVSEQELV